MNIANKIHLAPLQGFTDFIYRNNFAEIFGNIDKYFCPYISFWKQNEIRKSQLKDILPENNSNMNVVPQVLFSNTNEFRKLCKVLIDFGYQEINLNLGCPYPMATNKGRGSGLLQKPELIAEILKIAENEFDVSFSVKMRSGLEDDNEVLKIIEVLNQSSVTEIIYHPRIAKQLYKGQVNISQYKKANEMAEKPLVFNGDICSEEDVLKVREFVPNQNTWMIGRGILKNPFLAENLKTGQVEPSARNEKLMSFHEKMLADYSEKLEGKGHILQKMRQFWEYSSASFVNPQKVFKLVKKAGSLKSYNTAIEIIFRNYVIK